MTGIQTQHLPVGRWRQPLSHEGQHMINYDISDSFPSPAFEISHFKLPHNIFLADPSFNIPNNNDVLIGAQFYLNLILPGKFIRNFRYPIIQETKLGYIINDRFPNNIEGNNNVASFLVRNTHKNLATILENFWKLQEINTGASGNETSICEKHFHTSTTRNNQGKFFVITTQG
ncbi:uncharacterized protein LOC142331955 [Lycorma delicatula]|uniref:uncharacterized protein LOC142331955 n=1 Tax=Lycorma delicatula TaxID=130591 RepID=UPI003F514490